MNQFIGVHGMRALQGAMGRERKYVNWKSNLKQLSVVEKFQKFFHQLSRAKKERGRKLGEKFFFLNRRRCKNEIKMVRNFHLALHTMK
jgi:hypothetical protein